MTMKPRVHSNRMRIIAIACILSGAFCFLPETWLDSFFVWGGMGHAPHAVVFSDAMRQFGSTLIAFGALVWVIARDVVRYRSLVIALMVIQLIGAPVLCLIDV